MGTEVRTVFARENGSFECIYLHHHTFDTFSKTQRNNKTYKKQDSRFLSFVKVYHHTVQEINLDIFININQ